jgi:hypothetical protein
MRLGSIIRPRLADLTSLVVVTAPLLVASTPLRAIGPAIPMFYGGDLKKPVLVFPRIGQADFIWSPT